MLAVGTPARAQDIDPALRTDVEKLLEVTGAVSSGAKVASIISSQMIEGMRQQMPQVPDRAIAIVKEVLDAEFVKAFDAPDGLRADMVRIYASHFTRAEVAALLEFYATDIGRKAILLMPQLAEEGAAAGQKWAMAHMPRVTETLQQRLRAEGFLP
jgi:hypothetical protein